ncbi:DUF4097 family beta strand repeat-containing protein [Microbacterium gorillae]|uniref:hypothetical protein n=1 Tax=Microbacterium gorillae TaxID=1231063 RepID=UPI00059054AB|nr:hypothetical protein [Microbacterium gorillae]
MSQQLTPPPAPTTGAATAPEPRGRSLARTITIIGIIFIALVLVSGILTALAGRGAPTLEKTAKTDGVTAVQVNASAADLAITFSENATQAELHVTASSWQGVREWKLDRVGDTLQVGDDNGWSPFTWIGFNGENATLVLPAALEGTVDASLHLSAGSLTYTGDARAVEVDVSAGDLTFTGAAETVTATVSAGSAVVTTHDVRTVSAKVSAGGLTLKTTGEAPERTAVEVSAGSATLTLPDVPYAVSGGSSAGDRHINVRQDPSAPHSIQADISAGDITINPGN